MNQQVRTILFVLLSAALFFVWQAVFVPKPKPRKPAVVASADAGTPPAVAAPTVTTPAPGTETPAAPEAPAPEETAVVETNFFRATFSTKGGAVKSFELLGPKQRRSGKTGGQVDLATPAADQPLPLSVSAGQGFAPDADYRLVSKGASEIVYERSAGGTTLRKRFSWQPDSYVLALELTATRGEGGGVLPVDVLYPAQHVVTAGGGSSWFGGGSTDVHQVVCHLAGKGRSLEVHKYNETKPEAVPEGTPTFAAVDEKYFLAALMPEAGLEQPQCVLRAPNPGRLVAAIRGQVTPGTPAKVGAYLGPKDVDRLEAAGHDLESSVDFGFWAIICRVLLFVLKQLQRVVQNWGLAIIALTVLVKLVTLPLQQRQMKSMEEMRVLAPKIEELKAKYAGDQQRINVETMKLYKDHNVQPLGGCLPILVQMPVWFALYTTLQTSYELYNEPFVTGWISDLTAKDPYYVTPILMTVTMVGSQLLTPQSAQNEQMKTVMYVMPVVFGLMMMALPSGLVLYIFTNNVLSIAHSLWFRRTHGAPPAPAKA